MKSFVVVCFFCVVAFGAAHYTDKYDNVDLDEILGNSRALQGYVNCVLDLGKCSVEAKELKSHLVEAVSNECAQCTEAQHARSKYVMRYLINKQPEVWKQVCDKFDPKRILAPKYEKELREV